MSEEIKTDKDEAIKSETFAVKLDSDVKERLQQLIKDNKGDGTQGSVIEAMLNFYELNNVADDNLDFKGDLKALNQATSRIYNIYAGMIEKANINKEDMQSNSHKQLEDKQQEIEKLEFEIDKLKILEKSNQEYTSHITKEKNQLELEVAELEEKLNNNSKYIIKLEEEVAELKQYKSNAKLLEEENKALQNDLNSFKAKNMQLESTIATNKQDIDNLNSKLQDVENKHKQDIESLKSQLELEKQQEILKIKQDYQNQLQELQNQKMKEVIEYQDRYNKLLDKTDLEKEELKNQISKLESK